MVRQTTVLIAALATATGTRTPLSRVAGQVFQQLAAELKAQGLGNKVIADMFGMALRTYQHRMARLQESRTDTGRSLWEAVLAFVEAGGTVGRAEVLARFRNDDGALVRGILRDLVESRLIYQSGRGDQTVFRVAGAQDPAAAADDVAVAATLLQVALHRHGPVDAAGLPQLLPVPPETLDDALRRLLADGVVVEERRGTSLHYRVERLYVPVGDTAGWQAALFDHYQAVVTAMVTKLRRGGRRSDAEDTVGGSTYHFDIWEGHPLESEVLGLLRNLRRQAASLRAEVERHNAQAPSPAGPARRVTTYVGQTTIDDGEDDAAD